MLKTSVPAKANRILHLILVAMALLMVRLWHLTIIEHDQRLESANRPTRRTVIEPARRGTIRDRFNLPLAINQIQYNAAVQYSDIRSLPAIAWERNADGTRVKRYRRREHIHALAEMLAQELALDSERIADLIHAKASFYDHLPFIIKHDLDERQYYRLKSLERDWPGLLAQRVPKRYYPLGPIASDIIGYMGAINRSEYDALINERKALQAYLDPTIDPEDERPLPAQVKTPQEAQSKLRDLEERAYSLNDFVGKSGIEGQFEQDLRGFHGKKVYYSDSKGNYLRELAGGRSPLPGRRLLLTISADLQHYAEQLLIQNERIRTPRVSKPYLAEATVPHPKEPWIKGGAIVAIDPNTGAVLALASYPRMDPNDFIPSGNADTDHKKQANIRRWFESEAYLAELWDGKRPLQREICDASGQIGCEEQWLTWDSYLDIVLDEDGELRKAMSKLAQLGPVLQLQQTIKQLLTLVEDTNLGHVLNRMYEDDGHTAQSCRLPGSRKEQIDRRLKEHASAVAALKTRLDLFFGNVKHTYDKLLIVDLCHLAVCGSAFDADLSQAVGSLSVDTYQRAQQAVALINDALRKQVLEQFRTLAFKPWRRANEAAYLKERRLAEKQSQQHPKPYIDYLDAVEERLFNYFWKKHRWEIIANWLSLTASTEVDDEVIPYIKQGIPSSLVSKQALQTVKNTIALLPHALMIDFLKTFRTYHELNEPLYGHYRGVRSDQGQQSQKHLATAFYPVSGFGYGRSWAYRQAAVQGSVFKLVVAYQALIERYEALRHTISEFSLLNPLEIVDQPHRDGDHWNVGYTISGKAIPQNYKGGKIPRSLNRNIGRLDLIRALEASSNPYFALLASDVISEPQALTRAAHAFGYGHRTGIDLPGEISGHIPDDIIENRTGLYSLAIGQHALVVTPLQTATMLSTIANGGFVLKPQIVSLTAGSTPTREDVFVARRRAFPYADSLAYVGIDFPLFAAASRGAGENQVTRFGRTPTQILPMPPAVRHPLLEGMERVACHFQTQGLESLRQLYQSDPTAVSCLVNSKGRLVGKTSTGESTERLSLERITGTQTYNHIWFGAIGFDPEASEAYLARDHFGRPEIVVLVYLRYGGLGREGAPLVAQIVAKWREIVAAQQVAAD
jgi:cell division protein FtsI/penicillin-binding protein 2